MRMSKSRWVFSDPEQDKWLSGPWVIIADIPWYMDHEAEIVRWLESSTPGAERQGTVIQFANRDHQTMFKLRWS